MHGGDIYNNDVDIDFSVNLNPYHLMCRDTSGRSEEERAVEASLKAAVLEGLDRSGVYPDAEQTALRKAVAKSDGVRSDCVYAGCGASELLMATVRVIAPKKALIVEPCFKGYTHVLDSPGDCEIIRYHLKEENCFDLTDDILDVLSEDIDMIILADPNNPTGRNIDESVLEHILEYAGELGISVTVDESFLTISEKYVNMIPDKDSFIRNRIFEMIRRYAGVYIIRSYTKSFALPGIRMGYVISRPENIKKIIKQLPEWNLPALSETVMRRCARISENGDYYVRSMDMISVERAFLESKLKEAGMKVFPGNSVFLLFKGPEGLYEALLDKKILIRKCDDYDGLDGHYYRVAVRCRDDNEKLVDAIFELQKPDHVHKCTYVTHENMSD